jgi:hypothetical protein
MAAVKERPMNVTTDEEAYEALMSAYQVAQIAILNQILARNGIADRALRRRICAEHADASGSLLDRGWLQTDSAAVRRWPELVFATRTLDPEAGLGPADELLAPEYASNFHEYAEGNVGYVFDEHDETAGEIRFGSL